MSIILITSEASRKIQSIKRLKQQTASGYANAVEIIPYHGSHTHGLLKLNFKPFKDLALAKCFAPEMNLDLLWQVSWLFASKENPHPNWSGFMQQTTCSSTIYEKATVKFMPIIDLNPCDETCINSTLHFVIKQAEKIGIPTPCITFDQPLWLKATGIIKDQNLNIVCRLEFHTLMSFLGSIGKLMAVSGLEEVFEEVYAEHTVVQMFSGKTVTRSLRAHMLVHGALVIHLINALVDERKIDPLQLEPMYKKAIMTGLKKDELIEFADGDAFSHIEKMISEYTQTKKDASRTAKLWLLYIDYVSIVKEFLIEERTSNWFLHIQAVTKMMNLFAASGHLHYAKSSRIYVQEMLDVSNQLMAVPTISGRFEHSHKSHLAVLGYVI